QSASTASSSADAYSSVRLQVDNRATSRTPGSDRSSASAAGTSPSPNATCSRRATGAVWWLMPRAYRVMRFGWRPARRDRSGACDKLPVRMLHSKVRPTSMPVFPHRVRRTVNRAGLLACLAWACLAPAQAAEPLREDVLGATMAGEFALQAGRLDEAAGWYLDAARAAGDADAGLAERATRIALLGKDDRTAAAALDLWRERAPASVAMRAAEATLALRHGRSRRALRHLRALMEDPDPAGWRHALSVIATGPREPAAAGRVMRRLFDEGAVPDTLPARLAFGDLAQRLGGPEPTRRVTARLAERFPGEPRVALLRASQLREAGELEAARAALAEAGDAAAIVPELRLAMAAEYDALGDPATAEQLLARGPQDRHVQALRASLLAKAEDREALAGLYDELRRGAANPEPGYRLLLGQVAEFLDLHAQALEWYESVAGGEARLQARLQATRVLHELGRRDEAFDALHRLQADG